MKISFIPKSPLGKWSAWLVIFAIVVSILLYVLAELLNLLPEIVVSIFGSLSILAGIAALILSLIAILKNKERAILVFLAAVVGLIELVFIIVILTSDLG